MFSIYLHLGLEHILDLRGFDHILFVTALCAVYSFNQWKKVLVLVTAFTIGHSITLVLASLIGTFISSDIIEFLIPVTIFLTAIINLFNRKSEGIGKYHWMKYIMALFFGLIHGVAFSNGIRSLLGIEESIVMPLLAFNVGLEIGQIIIVLGVLLLALFVTSIFKVKQSYWSLFLTIVGLIVSFIIIVQRFSLDLLFPFLK